MTRRWKLTVEYDGGGFSGWQRQSNAPSVQECLENAIEAFTGKATTLHAAGRTDAGVHAAGQVAHVDLEEKFDAKTVRDAINFHIRPHPAAVVKAEPVSLDFHARFSATCRVYRYTIIMARPAPLVLDGGQVWHVWRELDVSAMNRAAQFLLGTQDFTSFRATECQAKSPIRTLDRLEFVEKKDAFFSGRRIELWAEAKSFLHHQVRNMTGTLKLVGEGKWQADDVRKALAARDRRAAGLTAPPSGLCLMRVDYPPENAR